ncbi:MAG: MMPL family transporter [Acidobacteriota bacterium]
MNGLAQQPPGARIVGLSLLAALILSKGLARLELDVNVFNLLPTDAPVVQGMEQYQRNFGAARELIVTLRAESKRAEDGSGTLPAAESLAEALLRSGLTPHVVWRSPLGGDPQELGELLAYLWLNQEPEAFAEMASRLRGEEAERTLEQTLDRLATSFNPRDVARLTRDPFSLSSVIDGLAAGLPVPSGSDGADPFASADGSLRILFVQAPFDQAGFRAMHRWVGKVQAAVDAWYGEHDFAVTPRVTGNPAFVSETGSGLLRDMRLAAVGTLLLVATLFWRTHRRWAPLGWLVWLLVLVVAATVVVGDLLLGALTGATLNAVSLGFATILLGLAADYGLILYQELIADPSRSAAEHRARVAPSILWASVTTAGAFLLIGRSSLPGLSQLGILVGLGILIAALTMLFGYLPPIAARARAEASSGGAGRRARHGWPSRRTAGVTAAAVGIFVAVLLLQGLPAIDGGTRELGPAESRAKAAMEEVREVLGGFDEGLWLLISGADESEVAGRLQAAAELLEQSAEAGEITGYMLPSAMWPRPQVHAVNRELAGELMFELENVRMAAMVTGFGAESLHLTEGVLRAWGELADSEGVAWPTRPGTRWLVRQFAAFDDGRHLALGRVDALPGATVEDLKALEGRLRSIDGAQLFGWTLLADSLLERMQRDVGRVLWPLATSLLVLLALAFRRLTEIGLSLAVLGFTFLGLMAVMSGLGWSWNLMNIMTLPLLFGAGVDYSIHIQLALRRHHGDRSEVYRTVGRAILLCGASTASGFGTLALASNSGLSSLGKLCAAGIVIASLCSVFLLPGWWRALDRRGSSANSVETAEETER